MHRRYPLLVALTLLAVAIGAWDGLRVMHNSGLPFAVTAAGTRAVRVEPLRDIGLPPGLQAGETIDLRTQPFATRAAILASLTEGSVRPGEHLALHVERGGRPAAIAFTTRRLGAVPELRLASWLGVLWAALICLTALITLWRGKDWGAWGISLWAIAFEAGLALTLAPAAGAGIVAVGVASPFLYLIARVGFYLMAESIAAPALTARTRRVLRAAFAVLLLAGMGYEIAAPLSLVFHALLVPQLIATVWALPYLLATAMLLLGYRRADARHRQRLHWTFWSSLVFVVGIQFSNVPLLGYPLSFVVEIGAYAVSMTGLLNVKMPRPMLRPPMRVAANTVKRPAPTKTAVTLATLLAPSA